MSFQGNPKRSQIQCHSNCTDFNLLISNKSNLFQWSVSDFSIRRMIRCSHIQLFIKTLILLQSLISHFSTRGHLPQLSRHWKNIKQTVKECIESLAMVLQWFYAEKRSTNQEYFAWKREIKPEHAVKKQSIALLMTVLVEDTINQRNTKSDVLSMGN